MKRDSKTAPETTGAQAVSRRDLLKSSGGMGLVGVAASTVPAAFLPTSEARADPAAKPGVEADDARQDLGGTPISDAEPFGDDGKMLLAPLRERVLALKNLLVERKVLQEHGPGPTIDFFINFYQNVVGPQYGKKVVAHAWTDPAFRQRLLEPPADRPFAATAVVADYLSTVLPAESIPQAPGATLGPEGEWLRVVANGFEPSTGKVIHNLITCSACSCYPQPLLGIQPLWYKSRAYRARSVSAPRGVLREFAEVNDTLDAMNRYLEGIDEVRVWDSTSEARFLVLPEMPPHWRGLSETELEARITRNSMVGVEILA